MSKTFWVLEAPWQPPHYLRSRKMGNLRDYDWTAEIDQAVQFSRHQDADAFLEFCLWGDVNALRALVTGPGPAPRAVEHSYLQT